jgi:hypothetical protein
LVQVLGADYSTQDYYEGMFTRLMKRVPSLSWYWIWTPEIWEWSSVNSSDPVFMDAVTDLGAAMAAKEAVKGFDVRMATNGWVVGPLPDRAIFDQELSLKWDAIASIDLNTGWAPVDRSYLNVTRHPKWVIPWMEDDRRLTEPQLWVNRTLQHMEDALDYGATGLLGIHWRTRVTSPTISAMAQKSWKFRLTSEAFWDDWTAAHFGVQGESVSLLSAVFQSVDSFKMPTYVDWVRNGPGGMLLECDPNLEDNFWFVDELKGYRKLVSGARYLAEFDYWANSFEYVRAIGRTECAWLEYTYVERMIAAIPSSFERKYMALSVGLPARAQLVANASFMMGKLEETISTPGELGTWMDMESRSILEVLNATTLISFLDGDPLPSSALPPTTFQGDSPRLIVPVARSTLEKGSPFELRALVLGEASHCKGVQVFLRPLGTPGAPYVALTMTNVGRSVYSLKEMLETTDDFEFYVQSCGGSVFPAGAPTVTQSVVWM